MSQGIRVSLDAEDDLVSIYERLQREASETIADRFVVVANKEFLRLAKMPGIGVKFQSGNPHASRIRFTALPTRFKAYLVFYRPIDDGIEILRVLYGARDIPNVLASLLNANFTPPDEV